MIEGKYIDEYDAMCKGQEWILPYCDLVKDNPSRELVYHNLENNNGTLVALWVDNSVYASFYVIRDEYNWSQLILIPPREDNDNNESI